MTSQVSIPGSYRGTFSQTGVYQCWFRDHTLSWRFGLRDFGLPVTGNAHDKGLELSYRSFLCEMAPNKQPSTILLGFLCYWAVYCESWSREGNPRSLSWLGFKGYASFSGQLHPGPVMEEIQQSPVWFICIYSNRYLNPLLWFDFCDRVLICYSFSFWKHKNLCRHKIYTDPVILLSVEAIWMLELSGSGRICKGMGFCIIYFEL